MNEKKLKVPPNNIEAEKALLGSIMLRPDSINEIIDLVLPKYFYSERHKIIYEAILELYKENKPLDIVSLSEKLNSLGLIGNVGGRSYLSEILESVPSTTNIKYYADIVYSKAMLRSLINAADEITSLGYDETKHIEEILDMAESNIYKLTNKHTKKSITEIKDVLGEAYERMERLHKNKDEMRGVPTGFKSLDNLLSGLQKSDLIILAARPSVGKTAFALNIARNVAVNHNMPVLIFSLEMGRQQLTDRLLAAQAQVDAWNLRTGKLKEEEDFQRIRDALDVLATAPIIFDDTPANNIISMRSSARKLMSEKGLGLIVVDYLQLMMPTQTRNSDNMVQQVTEISRSLKALARELEVPVVALSQLSRKLEDRGGRPRLSDLRDSGSIEQDADVVAFIHNPNKYSDEVEDSKKNIVQILVEKHRNGPTGDIELYFDKNKSSFVSIEKNDFSDIKDFENF